ncbi:transcription factor CP2-like isoform X1 [Rhopilema esculentum]|uniref:transcription factor CP2-like isoform X1 n=1 Tax=Rhopilema esculentum TaxID=499914 RepID=UPI0031DFDC5A
MANSWRLDDLDGGVQLATDLSNLHGLGAEFLDGQQAYNMSEVLSLPLFKSDDGFVETVTDISHHFSQPKFQSVQGNISIAEVKTQDVPRSPSPPRFALILKAPTSPGRKINEETLTYLNQAQSYEILLQCISGLPASEQFLQGVIRLGFHDRKYQVIESEKFDEWSANHPNERLLEIDVPMCGGIHEISNNSQYSNFIDFKWDRKSDTRLFFKINCVSSEFTKGKSGGESGIPLRLQIDIYSSNELSSEETSLTSAGCQIKVFKPKGADRKLKSEKQKHENLPQEELISLQSSNEVTVLKELEPLESSLTRASPPSVSSSGFQGDASWLSPCSSMFSQLQLTGNIASSTPMQQQQQQLQHQQQNSQAPKIIAESQAAIAQVQKLVSESTVEETQNWLTINRFNNFVGIFTNFKGSDLLVLTRSDLIQLCGPADGIRLHNALQARASRPLLTIYVSPEWRQSDTGMKEYHAIFLEHLTVEELRKKLVLKCDLEPSDTYPIYKQGPTGILIFVDDEMVRNFMDEAHFSVQVLTDSSGNQLRLVLR